MDENQLIIGFDHFIKNFARKYCRYPEDQEDFAQELRLKLCKAYREHYDPAKGKLPTWVYRTLLMWSRRLRFDMKKQDIFNKEMLNSTYYNEQHYQNDDYFLYVANLLGKQRSNSEHKYPRFESSILSLLTEDETRIYHQIMRQGSFKVSKICKLLKMNKESVEALYGSIKIKVIEAYEKVYHI
jgi:RNA polymerase sigma factor (sigma-70 family)